MNRLRISLAAALMAGLVGCSFPLGCVGPTLPPPDGSGPSGPLVDGHGVPIPPPHWTNAPPRTPMSVP